jgi:copper resistance protein C
LKKLTHKVLIGAAAVTFGLVPLLAAAHGRLQRATPAAGSTVDVSPKALSLAFNEDLEPAFSTVKVTDAHGAQVTNDKDDKAKVDASNPRVLTLPVPKLASGSYTVHWSVMTHDSHKTKGSYTFSVK